MSDCISRESAEAIFRNAKKSLYEHSRKGKIEYKEFKIREMMLLNAEQFIHLLPSVEPEKKIGKWICVNPMVDTLMCSECGYNIISEDFKSNFCPDCGAKMEVNE